MSTGSDRVLRISIADDHRMFVEALGLILDANQSAEVVSVAGDGHALLRDIDRHRPDIALVDLSMEGPPFQDLAARIREADVPTRPIALTMHLDRDLADRVLAAGFGGYVVKDSAVTELLEAIHVVADGGVFLSNALRKLASSETLREMQLTRREIACLEGAAMGQGNREIADALGVSERTVKFHLENLFRKLDVKSRGEAVAVARRIRLIE